MKRINYLVWLPIVALFVLGFILVKESSVGANLFEQSTPQTVKEIQAAELREALAQATDPETIQSLQEKLEPIEKAILAQATAQAQPTLSLEEICAGRNTESIAKTNPELGILAVNENFLATQNLKINNIFRGLYQDQIVEVYAGYNYEDSRKGLVIVSIEALEINDYYYDPNPDGALEIVAENNLRLELKTSNGAQRFFDIPAMQFVSGANNVVKSVDIPAAATPFQDPCAEFDQP
jgi:hypothetical protein